jgi:hypothetical protein
MLGRLKKRKSGSSRKAEPKVDSGEVLRAIRHDLWKRRDKKVWSLMELIDEHFGSDDTLVFQICFFDLGHLTTGRVEKGKLTVTSTKEFAERFGLRFEVTVDEDQFGSELLFYADHQPDHWWAQLPKKAEH